MTFVQLMYAQKKEKPPRPPFPNSIIDFGIGAGPNYGIFGFKTVIGYKGSGLILGTGVFESQFAMQVGVQVSYKWFFASYAYGTYGSATSQFGNTLLLDGNIAAGGGRINLLRNKKLFLELGVAYTWGAYVVTPFSEVPVKGPAIISGIGWRFFNIKKKEKAKGIDDEW
ncbi:MAG: hypothetical protein AB7O73_09500 [Bacteroidia bacterium]